MRIFGFIVFILGLIFQVWWIIVLGFVIYEIPGTTWLAAMMANSDGYHGDQGPLN